jgi:hypothetical protein
VTTDWLKWHTDYEAPDSPLAQRLGVVRQLLDEAVASHDGGRLRVLSLCAGDGRDVLPVLANWQAHKEISGRLVELQPDLADRARDEAHSLSLQQIEVICGDAAQPTNYTGAIPADLIVACGIFGNISDADVQRLVESMPAMCATGANVVWTRHRRDPDLTPKIREWFASAGFEEHAFHSPGPGNYSVGRHQMAGPRSRITLTDPLFTFVR